MHRNPENAKLVHLCPHCILQKALLRFIQAGPECHLMLVTLGKDWITEWSQRLHWELCSYVATLVKRHSIFRCTCQWRSTFMVDNKEWLNEILRQIWRWHQKALTASQTILNWAVWLVRLQPTGHTYAENHTVGSCSGFIYPQHNFQALPPIIMEAGNNPECSFLWS